MSVETEETIYNLIPKIAPRRAKAPRHKSTFHNMVKLEAQTKLGSRKTMGPAKVPVNSPQKFLQKHSKEMKLPENSTFKYPDAESRRPAVPNHKDNPQMGTKTTRNFITTNAVNNIMSVPRKPPSKYVDSPKGTKHLVEESGMVPKYTKKKDYGQTPHYLQLHNREMMDAQEQYDHYVAESLRRGQMEKVQEEERAELLKGLKKNWEELHHQYQGLSVVTDTVSKKARKERMEAEMKQLERDIDVIEHHKIIYIAQDQQ